ncbi:MAG: phosphoribosylformylglycinamidine cyclo-ligase [Planctomycetota bacterium]|jgi:phosphoribosylformylglycinamidine cyclo-ligase|nr:MAG: phosphoribosylformylglycinamidine cyclo-ligase [Planctomycetota bacterium]
MPRRATTTTPISAAKKPISAKKPRVSKGLTYAQAGVDIDAGDEVVERIKPIVRRTYSPRVMGLHGAFAGMFRLDNNAKLFKRNYKNPVLVACTDGVGTKVKLAAQFKIYDSVGIDCVAMNVNDLIVQGAEPLFFLDYLGLSKLDPVNTTAMIKGVAKGCEIAGCALLGGECAEMPDIYAPGDFDVAGFCVGVVELARTQKQPRVLSGDIVIGLPSSGVHSNGYTLVRRIVKDAKLSYTKKYAALGGKRLIDVLLEPTRIYVKEVIGLLDVLGAKPAISGMAHITGGGLPGNVCRALRDDVDALIDSTNWTPPAIFPFLQQHGGVETAEMFRVFNMGIGYTIIVRPNAAKTVMTALQKLGEKPVVIGVIAKGKGDARVF